jgi:hypothetical protein
MHPVNKSERLEGWHKDTLSTAATVATAAATAATAAATTAGRR